MKMMSAKSEIVENAERECKAHGVRVTKKRINIFAILLSSKKAVSAYEIVDLYKEIYEAPVPVITVYRVLDFLQSENLVHKLKTANKYVACTHNDCDHTHPVPQFLICKQCQKVKELSISQQNFEELKTTIEQAGFHFHNPQIEMNCICEMCYADAK